jgi:hypothetical protein
MRDSNFGGMGFSEIHRWKALGEMLELLVSMKEPMKTMLSVGMLIKKSNERSRRFTRTSFKVQEELMGIPSLKLPDYSELFAEEKRND